MSESDTMFNEWDWSWAAVQLIVSTDPSYDNRTIASTLKMQIWIAMNNRDMPKMMKTKFPAAVMVFGMVSSESHIMPPHIFEVSLKVNTKVYLDVLKSVVIPWCNQVACGRPWVWQQDSVPAHKSKETQAWLQKECYDFVPFSHWLPTPPIRTRWITSFGHRSRTSPTSPPTTPKPAWLPPSAELLLALVEKACSQFRICIEAVIEAEGGYIEWMSALLHNQVTWIGGWWGQSIACAFTHCMIKKKK